MTATLVKFNAAKRALAEAHSIDEVKDVRDKAEALRLYAIQQREGLEMQNSIAEIKIRAERRIGELLQEIPRDVGGKPRDNGNSSNAWTSFTSELRKIGIKRTQSYNYQAVANLPEERFERYIVQAKTGGKELTSSGVIKLARRHKKSQERQEMAQAEQVILPSEITILEGDFEQLSLTLPDESVDVIITDPPYPREYLYLYGVLAEQAARLLKPGGSLLTMAGQSYLPDLFPLMTPHIGYHWVVAYLTPGGQAPHIWQRNINAFWKPVLWFVKGKYGGDCVGDVVKSEINDKRFHDWGQSESGMAGLVRRFSKPGDLILDPFCGAGTTGVVSAALGRRFIGMDVDRGDIHTSRKRIAEVLGESERRDL